MGRVGATSIKTVVAFVLVAVIQATLVADAQAAGTGKSAKRFAKIEPALLGAARANPDQDFKIVVRTAPAKTRDHVARAGEAVRKAKGKPTHALGIVGGASAVVSGRGVLALANDPDIESVVSDRTLRASFDPIAAAVTESGPGILEVGAPAVWTQYGVTGRGVGVAVVDSGVAGHPDLAGRIVAAVDFTSATTSASPVPLGDPGGHGTHVAGLVAGDGTASAGAYVGVAPGASIVDVRVIRADGTSDLSTVLRGLQWILENRRTYNIRVANLSLGAPMATSYTQDPLATAAEILSFSGVLVVAAAGNGGPAGGTVLSPASDPYVLTVGALDDAGTSDPSDDSVATFSARGPTADGIAKPDLAAPGRKMVSLRSPGSTLDLLYPDRQVSTAPLAPPEYFRLSGTSMAAPVVAGVAALMFERNPTLTAGQVKHRLRETATALPFGSATTTGAGMVSAPRAVAAVDPALDYSAYRVTDAFAEDAYPLVSGQRIAWRDLGYNAGVDSKGLPWAAVDWSNVTWDTITWENITWETFDWVTITWETVTWETITWESTSALSAGALSGSGSGWALVN